MLFRAGQCGYSLQKDPNFYLITLMLFRSLAIQPSLTRMLL
jgi:hypothetical protein